jgi:hypothetical protein
MDTFNLLFDKGISCGNVSTKHGTNPIIFSLTKLKRQFPI